MAKEKWSSETPSAIRRLLRERRLSLIDLSRKSGLSYSTVFKIAGGYQRPTSTTRERIATALKVSPADIGPTYQEFAIETRDRRAH